MTVTRLVAPPVGTRDAVMMRSLNNRYYPITPQLHSHTISHSIRLLVSGKDLCESRSMDRGRRAMPVQNKACYQRHIKKCQDNHRERLAKMKPTIDCHAPSSMRKVATKTNAKKQQIMVSHVGNPRSARRISKSRSLTKFGVDRHALE